MNIMDLIHEKNPYEDFDMSQHKVDLQGWQTKSGVYTRLINQIQPKLLIEVGTWKGMSAIHMARHIKKINMDCKVLCVDTWLGGLEHWLQKNIKTRPWYEYLNLKNGYPSLYYQFLHNVIASEVQDYIVPFPTTSVIAARFLARNEVKADLIYIDGSHDETDVYLDLVNYYKILSPKGVIFGDDYTYDSVKRALHRFCEEENLLLQPNGSEPWIIRRANRSK